jgi:type II secretory pathway pseudopilin PulG
MNRSYLTAARRGLTLIELVVVMAVLIALAALILPRLDSLKGQADHAAIASNAADLSKVIETNYASSGAYGNYDTLVDSSGAILSSIWGQTAFGALPFTATTIGGAQAGDFSYQSFLDANLNGYFNVQAGTSNTNASTLSTDTTSGLQTLSTNVAGGSQKLAVLAGGSGHFYADQLFTTLVPTGVIPTSAGNPAYRLVAMGIGPYSSLVGTLLPSCPLDTQGDDPTQVYCRYFAIFKIYSSGKPAQLMTVVDHRCKSVDTQVGQFNTNSSAN